MSLHFKYSKSIPLPKILRAEFSTDHVRIDVFANISSTQLTSPSFPALISHAVYRVINSRPGIRGGFFRLFNLRSVPHSVKRSIANKAPQIRFTAGGLFTYSFINL